MRFTTSMRNTIESMQDMRMSAIDHEGMIKSKMFQHFAHDIQEKYPKAITEHQDMIRGTINHTLTLHVCTQEEIDQRAMAVQSLLDTVLINEGLKMQIMSLVSEKDYLNEGIMADSPKKVYI